MLGVVAISTSLCGVVYACIGVRGASRVVRGEQRKKGSKNEWSSRCRPTHLSPHHARSLRSKSRPSVFQLAHKTLLQEQVLLCALRLPLSLPLPRPLPSPLGFSRGASLRYRFRAEAVEIPGRKVNGK